MRGRDLFQIAKPAAMTAVSILNLLPRRVAETILVLFRGTPGHLGVGIRFICVRRLARSCGDNVAIYPYVFLSHLDRCTFGRNISIREFSHIGGQGGITIGDDVSIAHASSVLTEEHSYDDPSLPIRDAPVLLRPVTIGSNVWIGTGVKITAGINIGDDCVIGAGSVVTRSIPSNSVAVGVPARVLKPRVSTTSEAAL